MRGSVCSAWPSANRCGERFASEARVSCALAATMIAAASTEQPRRLQVQPALRLADTSGHEASHGDHTRPPGPVEPSFSLLPEPRASGACGAAFASSLAFSSCWRLLLLLLLLLSSLPSLLVHGQTAPPASAYTVTAGSVPPTQAGWMPGGPGAGGNGVWWFDDPGVPPGFPSTVSQMVDLNMAADRSLASTWPSTHTLSSNSGLLASFSVWLCFGPTLAQFPALNLVASGAGSQTLSFGMSYTAGSYVLVVSHHNSTQQQYAPLGATPPWAPYQWFNLGINFRTDGYFTFFFNGAQTDLTSSTAGSGFLGLPLTVTSFYLGGAPGPAGNSSRVFTGGFAQVRMWTGLTSGQLSSSNHLWLAQNPSVLVGYPAYVTGLPGVMDYCYTASPVTATIYSPFNIATASGGASSSATFTITGSTGVTLGSSPVIVNAGSSWRGTFTVGTNYSWDARFTVSFASNLALVGAPATRTIYYNSGLAVRGGAQFSSYINTNSDKQLASPTGVDRVVNFTAASQTWNWTAQNLGVPFPDGA